VATSNAIASLLDFVALMPLASSRPVQLLKGGLLAAFTISLLSFIDTSSLIAQTSSSLPPGQSSNTTVQRDPAALSVLQKAITALGGTTNWSAVRGATVTGNYIRDRDPGSTSFSWSDDWSNGARLKRDNNGSNGGHHSIYLQDASTPSTNSVPAEAGSTQKAPPRPRFDSVTAMVVHLPGAALNLAVDTPSYSITTILPPRSGPSNLACVRILTPTSVNGYDPMDLSICFSPDSSLPVSAYISLRNLFHSHSRLIEVVQYTDFQKAGTLTVPFHVSVISPARITNAVTIGSVSWNPAFSATTFSGGTK
jgi:hypothetical protein